MDLNLHILSEPFPILIDLNLGGVRPNGGGVILLGGVGPLVDTMYKFMLFCP